MNELIDAKDVEISGGDGKVRKFRIGRLPYLGGGRELCTMFVPTGLPKVGEYKANEALAQKMFEHIEAYTENGALIRLNTPQFVNSHIPDFLTGIKLEAAMLEHNMGFSVAEKMSGFLDLIIKALSESTTRILTASREQSSQAAKPRSSNSKRNTRSRTSS